MNCGGRVYKGDTIIISVPFDVEDYENLVITYSTTGYATVVKTEDEVTIEDGFITYVSDGGELDLLPDGVIYYTISYEVDGVDHVESTNTNLYLKTPAGYSGKTADDIYQDGYEAGLNDCSGTSCMLYAGEYVLDSQFEGNSISYPDAGYNGFNSFLVTDGGYGDSKFNQGYQSGRTECSENEVTFKFEGSVYEHRALWRSGDEIVINNVDGEVIRVDEGLEAYYVTARTSESSVTTMEMTFNFQNSQGSQAFPYPPSEFANVKMNDCYYLNILSQSRELVQDGYELKYKYTFTFDTTPFYDKLSYEAGQEDCSGGTPCDCSSAVTEAYQSGYTEGLNACSGSSCNLVTGATDFMPDMPIGVYYTINASDLGADGFSEFTVYDLGFGQAQYDSGFSAGYMSGISTDCSEAIAEAYESGWTAGQAECGGSAYPVTFKVEKNEQVWAMNLYDNDVVFLRINNVEVEDIDFSKFYAGSSGNPSYIDVSGNTNQNLLNVSRVELKLLATNGNFPDEWDKIYLNGNEIRDFAQNCTSASTEDGTVYQYLFNFNECDCTEAYESGWTAGFNSGLTSSEAFQSGYTVGYAEGLVACSSGDCSEAVEEAFNSGFTAGEESAAASCSAATEEAYESGYTAALGELNTIEILFSGTNIGNHYAYYPTREYPRLVAVMDNNTTCVYDYGQNSGQNVYLHEEWNPATNTLKLGFVGYFPNGKYLTPVALGVDILDSNLNTWDSGTWEVRYVRYNAEFIGGTYWDIGGGGIKVKPESETHTVTGLVPNSHQVLIHFYE